MKASTSLILTPIISYNKPKITKISTSCLLPILLSFLLLSLQQIVLHPNSRLVVMPVSIIMKNQAERFFCTWLELLRGFLRMSVDCPKCDQKESNKIEPCLCDAIGVFGIYDKSFLEFHSATKRTRQDSIIISELQTLT